MMATMMTHLHVSGDSELQYFRILSLASKFVKSRPCRALTPAALTRVLHDPSDYYTSPGTGRASPANDYHAGSWVSSSDDVDGVSDGGSGDVGSTEPAGADRNSGGRTDDGEYVGESDAELDGTDEPAVGGEHSRTCLAR